MSADMPARSTPQLDLMRRLRVRDAEHPAMSFLDDSERERVDRILESSVEKGLTKKVQREAHAFLVTLGQRDASLGFLNEAERVELNRLVSFNPPPASSQKKQVHSPKRSSSMSAGEFLTAIGVVLSVAGAAYFILKDPTTAEDTIWVGVWGVVCGTSFINSTRRRSSRDDDRVSVFEGFLAALIWLIASGAVVLLSGHHLLSPGWSSLLSFIGAGMVGRSVLKIESDDED